MKKHSMDVKIYYEDTDSLGLVYHANYLKYMERGRTEFIGASGKPISQWNSEGYNFAVYEMKIKFAKAAKLGDICQIITAPGNGGSDYRRKMQQRIELDGRLIVEAEVDLVCLDSSMKLIKFPAGLIELDN